MAGHLIGMLVFLLLIPSVHALSADMIIGGDTSYTVRKGDSFQLIGARLGVYWKVLARQNGFDIDKAPPEGTRLMVNTRKIVPRVLDNGIVVNIADRTLYFFNNGKLWAIPVGVGTALDDPTQDWKTPTGKFAIVRKRKDPIWYVPPSIQREMAVKGKPVEEAVPAGPDNPIGRYALVTSIPGLLIHETIRPRSVYRYLSHGCIRVLPEHMEELYPQVEVNTTGEIIYEPVKLAVNGSGKIYLEVRTDAYKKLKSLREHTRSIIDDRGLSERVDWVKVDELVKAESGIAEDVTLSLNEGWKTVQALKSPLKRFVEILRSWWR